MAYVISLLTGRACLWGTAEWECDFKCFSEETKKVFDLARPEREASSNLLVPFEETQPVAEYTNDFYTAVADSTLNDSALYGTYHQGLSECLKDKPHEMSQRSLDLLVTLG